MLAGIASSLQARLLGAHLLVIGMGTVTLLLGTALIGPSFFERHLAQMGGPGPGRGPHVVDMQAEMGTRLTQTFHQALGEALGLATLASLITATVLSFVLSQRVAGPIRRVSVASRRLAGGHYEERVPATGPAEITQLVESFNQMAAALEGTERRRLELIADVSHELRTPLATLEGYLEGLLDGVVEPSTETWNRLHRETRRLHRLVEDLQELSRAEAHQIPITLRSVEPELLVRESVGRLAADFQAKELDLQVLVPGNLPPVQADPDRGVQVLTNLLTNALRYTPSPGQVRVSARRQGDRVQFEVADSGIGIAVEELPHVFDRFYRVDKSRAREHGGSGVGLTVAKALVEVMGGRIWAHSAGVGHGATFGFDLPIWSGPPAITETATTIGSDRGAEHHPTAATG